MRWFNIRNWLAACALLLGSGCAVCADDVRILAAGAVQKPVQEIIKTFEAGSAHKVVVAFDTVGALRDRVLAGEEADVILLSDAGLEALEKRGRLWQGRITRLGMTTVAICVPETMANVDISTPEKLAALLRSVASIAHADPSRGATAGSHFRKVVAALGLEEELRQRITVVPFGGTIAGEVAAGKYVLGVSQMTEIATVPGVRGYELPEPHVLRTVYGFGPGRKSGPGAEAFIALLVGEAGRVAFTKAGFNPPRP